MIQMAMIHIMVRRLEPTCQYPLSPQIEAAKAMLNDNLTLLHGAYAA
jgi:hypothetical protein